MKTIALALMYAAASSSAAVQSPIAIVAHRGLEAGVPENTLAAFRQSAAHGIKVIELDLRQTKDGQIVILHDETMDRTTNCSGRVTDMTLKAVRACDAGWPTHRGEHVPTFAEALDFAQSTQIRLLLDVKSPPIEQVFQMVRDRHAETRVILGLRRASDIARARAELPGATTLAFMPEISDASTYARAGAQIIRLWSDWVDADPGLVARTRSIGPQVWVMVGHHLPSKDREWRELHGRMIAAGAQGLISNRPDLIPGR